jgi:hypothetical protein
MEGKTRGSKYSKFENPQAPRVKGKLYLESRVWDWATAPPSHAPPPSLTHTQGFVVVATTEG